MITPSGTAGLVSRLKPTWVPKGAHDQPQIEVDEGEQDRAGTRRDKPIAERAEGLSFFADAEHDAGVVLHPADEEGARRSTTGRATNPIARRRWGQQWGPGRRST